MQMPARRRGRRPLPRGRSLWEAASRPPPSRIGIDKANTGHHHLLIDAPLPPLDKPIPNDENHLHFGGGQTETTLTLPTGRHTLQLLLGDTAHLPHEPPVYSDQIVVYVGMSPPVRRHRPHHRHNTA